MSTFQRLPTSRNFFFVGRYLCYRLHEVIDQHDVAIDVADEIVGGDLLGLLEECIQQGRAELVPRDVRHVLDAILAAASAVPSSSP